MCLRYIFLYFMIMLILPSCEKEIHFDYIDIDPLPVIEATLSQDGARIAITMTTPMDEPMNQTRLTDATVVLTDIDTGISRHLSPDAAGYFTDSMPGVAGHRYRLSVDLNDSHFEAETEMYSAVEITSMEFNWIRMPYDDVAVLQGKFKDKTADNGDWFWVRIFRNGELYDWNECDDRGVDDGICTYMTMTSRRNPADEDDRDNLYDGDVIKLTVCPISREMHNYLEALQNDSNGPFMFSGERCLGYFLASDTTSRTVVFRPDEIPYY